mgnify:CR=1 FL=1
MKKNKKLMTELARPEWKQLEKKEIKKIDKTNDAI